MDEYYFKMEMQFCLKVKQLILEHKNYRILFTLKENQLYFIITAD